VDLPPIAHATAMSDNWQSSAWTRKVPGLSNIAQKSDHFD
jgi:hypothetical protein